MGAPRDRHAQDDDPGGDAAPAGQARPELAIGARVDGDVTLGDEVVQGPLTGRFQPMTVSEPDPEGPMTDDSPHPPVVPAGEEVIADYGPEEHPPGSSETPLTDPVAVVKQDARRQSPIPGS
jgi:hypothetical protein